MNNRFSIGDFGAWPAKLVLPFARPAAAEGRFYACNVRFEQAQRFLLSSGAPYNSSLRPTRR